MPEANANVPETAWTPAPTGIRAKEWPVPAMGVNEPAGMAPPLSVIVGTPSVGTTRWMKFEVKSVDGTVRR